MHTLVHTYTNTYIHKCIHSYVLKLNAVWSHNLELRFINCCLKGQHRSPAYWLVLPQVRGVVRWYCVRNQMSCQGTREMDLVWKLLLRWFHWLYWTKTTCVCISYYFELTCSNFGDLFNSLTASRRSTRSTSTTPTSAGELRQDI